MEKLFPDPFLEKKSKFRISQYSKILYSLFSFFAKLRTIESE